MGKERRTIGSRVVWLLSLACASAQAAPPAPPANLAFGAPSQPAGRSAGCGKTPPAGSQRSLSVVVPSNPGVTRTYEVMVPTVYDPDKPLPLSFVFHERGGGSNGAIGFGLQNAPGARENGLFVFPQGLDQGGGTGWDERCGGVDMAFVDAILAQMEDDYCVDTERIFAAGFSWGGDMANSAGWCKGAVFLAVAPASGGDLSKSGAPSGRRAAFRLTYDSADPFYTFDTVINQYRTAHACASTGTVTAVSNTSGTCTAYADCDEPVVSCLYSGLPGGHSVPQPSWGSDTWSFFSSVQSR